MMPTRAEAGMVRIQAMMILPANPHRTPESRFVAPTPMMDVAMTWVVETGTP